MYVVLRHVLHGFCVLLCGVLSSMFPMITSLVLCLKTPCLRRELWVTTMLRSTTLGATAGYPAVQTFTGERDCKCGYSYLDGGSLPRPGQLAVLLRLCLPLQLYVKSMFTFIRTL